MSDLHIELQEALLTLIEEGDNTRLKAFRAQYPEFVTADVVLDILEQLSFEGLLAVI